MKQGPNNQKLYKLAVPVCVKVQHANCMHLTSFLTKPHFKTISKTLQRLAVLL